MASKPIILASLLGASIGVPYFTSVASLRNGADTTSTPPPAASASVEGATATSPPLQAPSLSPPPASAANSSGPVAPLSTAPSPRSPSAEQALRFDVTKEWVYRSWDRKSAGPTDVGLYAVRVPLVSGTQSASLAGSLTYYFNVHDQVEHITFRGRTGDPSRLIQFLVKTYEFEPATAPPGEYLYQVTRRSSVQSELRTRQEGVSTTQHGTYSVELELARPGTNRYLPTRAPQLNIPPAAPEPAQAATQGGQPTAAGSANSSSGSYFSKVRYPTPQEEAPKVMKRWPN
jgi:hypothetical protein